MRGPSSFDRLNDSCAGCTSTSSPVHLGSDLGVPDAGRQGHGDEVGGQDGARVLAGGRHAAARAHRAHPGCVLGVRDAGRQARGNEVEGQDDARAVAGGRHAAARAHRAHASPGRCTRVCVTPDGKHAVTKSDDKTARVWWSLKDGTLQRELTGHSRAPGRLLGVRDAAGRKHVVTDRWTTRRA